MLHSLRSCAGLLALWMAVCAPSGRARAEAPPRIEVAFALDTTGSMGSYIQMARERIRGVAEALAEGEPRPQVRFALVEYRDKSDDFVTRVNPFTERLEAMQGYLDASKADGGGDEPEAVLEGLSDAIHKLGWSPLGAEHDDVIRLLYLVGDAPAQHYAEGPSEDSVEKAARARGIVIHAIVCGSRADAPDSAGFERLARHTEGRQFALGEPSRQIRGASMVGFGAAVAETTRAYSASTGVRFAKGTGTRVETSAVPAPSGMPTGLLGSEVRWVKDAATFSDLWAIHTSLLPFDKRPPVPSVDFARTAVLVLGGADGGLALAGLYRSAEHGRADVHSEGRGVSFVLVPNAEVKP